MTKQFYMVHTKKGFDTYYTWKSCYRATHGVKGVLAYKGFNNQEEADYWIAQQLDNLTPIKENDISLYCDGGSRTFNSRYRKKGSKVSPIDLSSWAYVIVQNDKEITHDSGFMRGRTNNYQELNACYHGLNFLKRTGCKDKRVHLITDSKYLISVLNYDWKHNKNDKKPNLKAGKTLSSLFDEFTDIHIHWVKGHQNNKYNNMCDELCTKEMERNQ